MFVNIYTIIVFVVIILYISRPKQNIPHVYPNVNRYFRMFSTCSWFGCYIYIRLPLRSKSSLRIICSIPNTFAFCPTSTVSVDTSSLNRIFNIVCSSLIAVTSVWNYASVILSSSASLLALYILS